MYLTFIIIMYIDLLYSLYQYIIGVPYDKLVSPIRWILMYNPTSKYILGISDEDTFKATQSLRHFTMCLFYVMLFIPIKFITFVAFVCIFITYIVSLIYLLGLKLAKIREKNIKTYKNKHPGKYL